MKLVTLRNIFVARIQQWIENAREIIAPHIAEAPQENEDSVSTASSLLSSHLSVRQLKAKQALAELKLCQLRKKQALLRQEEETKLELEIVDAQYEIHRTDLQLKFLRDEEPAALTNLQDVLQDLNPSTERGYVGTANVPKQEPSDSRVQRKIGSQNVQLRRSLRVGRQVPLYPLHIQNQLILPCLEELWIRWH